MACLTSEKSPLAQKRGSLPGPGGGSLNLYANHQQRRLSERGLMIYKPNKPDIDLIRDFNNANQRKHSTPNITLYPGAPGPSCSSGAGLKYAQGTFGSLSQLNRNFYSPASAGPSPSAYRRNSSLASFGAYSSQAGISESFGSGNNTNTTGSSTSSGAAGGTARKVRIRIQKNPGAAPEKYVELHSIGKKYDSPTSGDEDQEGDGGLDGDEMTEDERNLFLRSPHFETRRHSDSAVGRGQTPAITFSLTSDTDGNGFSNAGASPVRRASDSSGVVLCTGDLETLKCLTSSAQEISSTGESTQTPGDASPTKGGRSKSFDATLSVKRGLGLGSSWFTRRHLPISHKLPSAASTPGGNQPLPQIRTPILTITNENACQSELIEIPSPPTVTPVSSGGSPAGEVASTVTWDKNGYVLDAALLGSAIESHLKEGNRKRRATFSTLYQAPPSSVECKVTTRARSASACVIPINPKELLQGSSGSGTSGNHRRESISTDRVIPNFPLSEKANRRSSLKSIVRFPWDSCKDPQSPETKALLWESPVEYTNSGSFIRATVTDFGAECIDEEDEESRTPETTNSTGGQSTSTLFGKSGETVVNIGSRDTPVGGNGKRGIKGFELPSTSSKGKVSSTGDRDLAASHSQSAPASPKPTKRGSESSMSICSAIRDFIIHSIRS